MKVITVEEHFVPIGVNSEFTKIASKTLSQSDAARLDSFDRFISSNNKI